MVEVSKLRRCNCRSVPFLTHPCISPFAINSPGPSMSSFYKVALLAQKVWATLAYLWYRPTYQLELFIHRTLHCWTFPKHRLNSLGALFLLQPHPSGTLYLLTLDCVRAFPHSSATWKPICSDSLSPPVLQAPLYLRTSRHYTNVLLLLLLILFVQRYLGKALSTNHFAAVCGKMWCHQNWTSTT